MNDFLLTSLNGDLNIINGDLSIGNTDFQNQHDIILFYQGELKQFPNVGVGLNGYLGGDFNMTVLKSLINSQLKNDGFKTKIPTITFDGNNNLNIITNATR